jgi:hypothetical protein
MLFSHSCAHFYFPDVYYVFRLLKVIYNSLALTEWYLLFLFIYFILLFYYSPPPSPKRKLLFADTWNRSKLQVLEFQFRVMEFTLLCHCLVIYDQNVQRSAVDWTAVQYVFLHCRRKLQEPRRKALEKIFGPKRDEIITNLGQGCTNPGHHICRAPDSCHPSFA